VDQKEGVEVCLRALQEMKWGFSKSEERDRNVRMIWDVESAREHSRINRFKSEPGSAVAAGGGELDRFAYSVLISDGHACSDSNPAATRTRTPLSSSMQPNISGQGHGYLDPAVVFAAAVTG
jgi:hypothetical protein